MKKSGKFAKIEYIKKRSSYISEERFFTLFRSLIMETESNASALRIHKNKGFTIMSNHRLRNSDLSLKGETAVRAALHELIDNKYIYVEKKNQ